MPQVFISYSHDDDNHKARVHDLADHLAKEKGIDVVLDRDVGPGGPDEGWPAWSERQVRESDRVLIACTEIYTDRYEGNDDDTDRGRGTVIEARAIQQFLYDSKFVNARFRVVLFDPAHEDHIPHQLKGYHWFNPSEPASYAELIEWLNAGSKEAEESAPDGLVWPEPDLDFRLPLADRRPHFYAVRGALSGQSSKRIFLFKGGGNCGKTEFLNELITYASSMDTPWTRFDFKGATPISEFYETVLFDLGADDLDDAKASTAKSPLVRLVKTLQELKTPVLLLFDTYEKASEESQTWLETKFLPRVRKLPAVVVVIGGRDVPDSSQYPWKSLAEFRAVEPIKDVEDWKEYLDRIYGGLLKPEEIKLLIEGTKGEPGGMRPILENLKKQRGDR